jgi:LPS export ABC transporter permease LptF
MFRILDRYLTREILVPSLLALVVLTFVLEIPPILKEGATLVAQGVAWTIVGRVLLTLLPQALSITIPMALLIGILIGFGRMSADREFVALQACGVSLFRLLRPIVLLATIGTAATAYETIVALPNANQTFREITLGVVADKIDKQVKPRVFFTQFPDRVIYVQDVPPSGGWRDVFLADSTSADHTTVYFAKEGRISIDRDKKTVALQLLNGTSHTTLLSKPDQYEGTDFRELTLSLDPATIFPPPPTKGVPEMTIAELRQTIAENTARGITSIAEPFFIQLKFSLAVACPVLALIGLALGATNRQDGKLASFVLGIAVIFVYYILLYGARALGMSGRISPTWAPWIANIVLGLVGAALTVWRARAADRPLRFSIPAFWQRAEPAASAGAGGPLAYPSRERVVIVLRVPRLDVWRPRLLDAYVARQYLYVFGLGVVALLGIFYIATFIDFADKLIRGTATTRMLLAYFYYRTPEFVSYVIPMSALVSTLVTIGVMTKNSELIVMRACGISLYRVAAPLVLFGAAFSAVLFGMQEQILPESNREWKRLEHHMRGFPPETFGLQGRRWIVSRTGDVYHYDAFNPHSNIFDRLSIYHIDPRAWRLEALTYAKTVMPAAPPTAADAVSFPWRAIDGWTREFTPLTTPRRGKAIPPGVRYEPFPQRDLRLEPPVYFKTEVPAPEEMTYAELAREVAREKTSALNAVPDMVELQRKIAFPMVTIVMTLLAIPFAVTTGRRGALYGIGIGIVLAIVYWIAMSVSAAMGSGGLVPPMLAAWAPNILFSAAAAYLILTVRT